MPDYPYNPDFPFVVTDHNHAPHGRFSTLNRAKCYVGITRYDLTITDTTPAPLPTKFGAIVKSAGIRHVLVDPRDTGYEWRTEAGAGFSRTEELQAKGFEVLFEGLDGD